MEVFFTALRDLRRHTRVPVRPLVWKVGRAWIWEQSNQLWDPALLLGWVSLEPSPQQARSPCGWNEHGREAGRTWQAGQTLGHTGPVPQEPLQPLAAVSKSAWQPCNTPTTARPEDSLPRIRPVLRNVGLSFTVSTISHARESRRVTERTLPSSPKRKHGCLSCMFSSNLYVFNQSSLTCSVK